MNKLRAQDIKSERPKPSIYLTMKDLPAIKDYDVGDTYYALYKCKMTGKHEDEGRLSGDFRVLDINPIPDNKVKAVQKLI
jgi:hypothetical protein